MNSLFDLNPANENFCIWQKLLAFLGQPKANFRCETCSRCKPKAGDVRVRKIDDTYIQRTPKLQIPVYAFAHNRVCESVDADRVKQLLLEHQGIIAAGTRNSWLLFFVIYFCVLFRSSFMDDYLCSGLKRAKQVGM